MVVLGGMGNITGGIISSSLITILQVKLATLLSGNLAVLQNVLYALILVLIVIYNNAPRLKGFREKHNIKTLFKKIFKKKDDPSNVRDDEAKWDRVPTKINVDDLLSMDLVVTESVTKPDKGGKNDE